MNLVSYDGHSLDLDQLTRGGWIIDVGCRNFIFTRLMLDQGFRLFAMDPDPTVTVPSDLVLREDFRFLRAALVGHHGADLPFAMHDVDVARHLVTPEMPAGSWPVVSVPALTISEVIGLLGVTSIEALKLDCEGSEYGILREFPGPVARQVSVEFHEHTGANPGGIPTYGQILSHMSRWYDCPGLLLSILPEGLPIANFWDSCWFLRGPG